MTGRVWLVAVLLVVAAAAVAWPLRAGRARRRAVLGAADEAAAGRMPPGGPPWRRRSGAPAVPPQTHALPGGLPGLGGRATEPARTLPARSLPDRPPAARPLPARPPGRRDPTHPGARLGTAAADRPSGRLRAAAVRSAWRARIDGLSTGQALLLAIVVGGGTGAVLGGPVAGVVLAAYAALGARGLRRRQARRAADRAHRHDLDQLAALAADLRAGLPVAAALRDGAGSGGAGPAITEFGAPDSLGGPGGPCAPGLSGSPGLTSGPRRIGRMARAAVRLADRTGAPLAELLERVEADARAADRGLAAAAAQAAGARATAWLLAALPVGGIGLGYAIGVDPVAVLLHTAVGGASAIAAVALQVGGLLWAERLGTAPGRAA